MNKKRKENNGESKLGSEFKLTPRVRPELQRMTTRQTALGLERADPTADDSVANTAADADSIA